MKESDLGSISVFWWNGRVKLEGTSPSEVYRPVVGRPQMHFSHLLLSNSTPVNLRKKTKNMTKTIHWAVASSSAAATVSIVVVFASTIELLEFWQHEPEHLSMLRVSFTSIRSQLTIPGIFMSLLHGQCFYSRV